MKTPTNIDTPVANLLQYSEQFDNAVWGKDGGSTITPDNVVAPTEVSTASTFTKGGGSFLSWAHLFQNCSGNMSGQTWTFSIWLKVSSGTLSGFSLGLSDYTTLSKFSPAPFTVTSAWQRFSFTASGFNNTGFISGGLVVPGAAGTQVQIWGAQLENGAVATAYASTITPGGVQHNNLITWLQTATEIRMADLFTFTLKSGAVFRYTTWDTNLVVLGNTFLTGPPHIARSAIEEKLGLDAATLELTIEAGPNDTVNGVQILQGIDRGGLDGAALRIDRLFMDSSGRQIGTVVRFSGFMGQLEEMTRTSAKITVNAGTAYLNMQLPSIILQPGCTNTLFDPRCGLSKPTFGNNLTVQAGSTANKIITTSGQPAGYFDNGQLIFTSGLNSGLTKAIRQFLGGIIYFNSPLPYAPNAGDTFIAYPGCDKTQSTCTNKFNNLPNFEGFPYVPAPETAI